MRSGALDKVRTQHLAQIRTPTLICQGERDTMGSQTEVERYALSDAIRFCWLEDGDHGFKPRKASGTSERANFDRALSAIANFVTCITD